jgi:hypothetical protein
MATPEAAVAAATVVAAEVLTVTQEVEDTEAAVAVDMEVVQAEIACLTSELVCRSKAGVS